MRALILAREAVVIDLMVSLIRAEGVDAAGTTSDDEAISQLESGAVGGLVIGAGVQEASRRHLSTVAADKGIAVIHGNLRGKDPQAYARDELVPRLREVLR